MFYLRGFGTSLVNVWYLSFHGGTERHSRNNIHIYSATGDELGKALNRKSLPDDIELRDANFDVADRETNAVTIYEPGTGRRIDVIRSEHLSKPIHLALDPSNHYFLIGNYGDNSV